MVEDWEDDYHSMCNTSYHLSISVEIGKIRNLTPLGDSVLFILTLLIYCTKVNHDSLLVGGERDLLAFTHENTLFSVLSFSSVATSLHFTITSQLLAI